MSPSDKPLGFASRALHSDEGYNRGGKEVAPNISLTTTFRHPRPDQPAVEWDAHEPGHDIYSRYTQPTLTRAEKVLSSLIGAPTILYPSGIAATFAILLLIRPDTISVTGGYHGCHAAFEVYRQMRGADQVNIIELDDEYPTDRKLLVWVETPLNPTGEVRSIAKYSKKAHTAGAVLAVDATFAPPPIQDPFAWGADIVMHSATKYFGGHSDALTGTVSVKDKAQWMQLWHNRTYTGATPGSLEAWLVLRSLRTLKIRVLRQAETATALAQWLAALTRSSLGSTLDGPEGVVDQVWHATLQEGASDLVGEGKQMVKGSACFAFTTTKPVYAEWLGHCLKLFMPATSLGGVESLIEQRKVSDAGADPRLIRLSIGLEDFEDLKADLIQGFNEVVKIEQGKGSKL